MTPRETIETYTLAGIGLVTGFLRYYVIIPIEDRINNALNQFIPSEEELDAYIKETAQSETDVTLTNVIKEETL